MAYATTNPPHCIGSTIGGTVNVWVYESADTKATVVPSNYFTNGYALGMRQNDVVYVIDTATPEVSVHMIASHASDTINLDDGVTATRAEINSVVTGNTATAAEITRTCDPTGRVVATTATTLSLTITEHSERLVVVNTNSTVANTFTLPVATGSGSRITVLNNLVQTQGTVVVAANGTDVMQGFAFVFDSTGATAGDTFATTATSDKLSMNLTTTGGLGGDLVECIDLSANTWLVQAKLAGSGTKATPFSAT